MSLRKLNWPAVMSQYSELSDLLPPHSYQPSPRLSLTVSPGQLVTTHIWQCGQLQWWHRNIWNLCLKGPRCRIRNPTYRRFWRLWEELLAISFLHCYCYNYTSLSTLHCYSNTSSFLFVILSHTLTADLLPHLPFRSALCFIISSCTLAFLLAHSSIFFSACASSSFLPSLSYVGL